MSPFFIALNSELGCLVLRRPIRAPGNDFLDTPQVHPCRLYAGIPAVEGPETRHPKLGSDLFVSLKDTLFRFGQ